MNFVTLKQKAIDCFSEAAFISRINNEAEQAPLTKPCSRDLP